MAQQSNFKAPPSLDSEDGFSDWLFDLEVWQLFTDLANAKQGPAVFQCLTGTAKETARGLTSAQIGAENGVELIKNKLQAVFLKDVHTRCFLAFREFYNLRRSAGTSITDFLVTFDTHINKLSKLNIVLPEGVKAFFLLTAANVSEDSERLARTTCGAITFENMKECIRKIFNDTGGALDNCAAPPIKSEPLFLTSNRSRGRNFQSNRGRGFIPSRGRGFSDNVRNFRGRDNLNARDKDGKFLRCFGCGSNKHFFKDCKSSQQAMLIKDDECDNTEQIHITLFSSKIESSPHFLLNETFGVGILDTGCTKTVTGDFWLKTYIDSLDSSDKDLIVRSHSKTKFCFGDGEQVIAEESVKFPAYIGSLKVYIQACVVANHIPLLISRNSMKNASIKLDCTTDSAMILGKKVNLISTKAGHYGIQLSQKVIHPENKMNIVLHVNDLKNSDMNEKKKKALKLHRQLCHASKEKLVKLVKESKYGVDKQFLQAVEECCDECELCRQYKRQPLRPSVGLRLADSFNGVVAIDLKEVVKGRQWILHMIDVFSRYSAATFITSKKASEIVKKICSLWIIHFGPPKKFLSDNGKEFSNEMFHELNEMFNIETATTAAESPFSNGVVERHHLIVVEAMEKTVEDLGCEKDMALAYAVAAKNSLQNRGGYSPNQLVFGMNPNFPSILSDKIPALESQCMSDVVSGNLKCLQVARKNFIQAESSERIRRALKSKVRSYSDEVYENGEKVYYRRKNFKGWKGPAVVIGVDHQMVLVRHGGIMYRCHPCHLMKVRKQSKNEVNAQNGVGEVGTSIRNCGEADEMNRNENLEDNGSDEDNQSDAEVEQQHQQIEIDQNIVEQQQPEIQEEQELFNNSVKPSRNQYVKYRLNPEDDWREVKVLSIQPKQSGMYKNWVNVENPTDQWCVNWDDVYDWSEVPCPEQVMMVRGNEEFSQKIVDAKVKELENMKSNHVFEEVEYTGQKTISSRWVYTEKYKEGEQVVKARLVARGFEEKEKDLLTESPTCSKESVRLVMITAASMSWKLQAIDFTSAFLQGGAIERDIYLRLPRDVCDPSKVWKLKKTIYGLRDAPRSWYVKVKSELLKLKAAVSKFDQALFLWHDDRGGLKGIMACHVDDVSFCGDDWFQSNVVEVLKRRLRVGAHSIGVFKYLGLTVFQSTTGVSVQQDSYIPGIEPVIVSKERSVKKNESLLPEERYDLKSLGGQLLWASSQTRPDISYEACQISNMGKNPTIKNIHNANKALSKLKSKKVEIKFPKLTNLNRLRIVCFSDATHASLPDGGSQGGFIVFIQDQNKNIAPITWQSKRLNRVSQSPLASETMAVCEAADAGFLVASMVQEIYALSYAPPVLCFTDNASLCEVLKTSKIISDRRLRVDIARLREMVKLGEVVIQWVPGSHQLADSFTKPGVSTKKMLDTLEKGYLS